MPKEKWFTPNPFLAESGISSSKWSNHHRGFPLMKDEEWTKWINELEPSFKQKWMNNGIYELIMLSKTIVIVKPELLSTLFFFGIRAPIPLTLGWAPCPRPSLIWRSLSGYDPQAELWTLLTTRLFLLVGLLKAQAALPFSSSGV